MTTKYASVPIDGVLGGKEQAEGNLLREDLITNQADSMR
jgi:hypothetical protein